MRLCGVHAPAVLAWLSLAAPACAQNFTYADLAAASLGDNAPMNGAVPFPADNAWNTDISGAPVDPNSANLIASIGLATGLHPDFGSGTYGGSIIGIPYVVVSNSQAPVHIKFTLYGDQSDRGPYPVPPDAPIEGSKPNGHHFGGDRHVLVLDRDSNRIYEMWESYKLKSGGWKAGAGAIFHADSDDVRPTQKPGWTSADAAGLPIFPGLVRYDEAGVTGLIPHALRFTVQTTRMAYVPPANHCASDNASANLPPMGMRVRLKASYVIPPNFSAPTRAILQALKSYGMMVADNGSNWFISGAPDTRWNNGALVGELGQVQGSNFEVIQMNGIVTPPNC